MTTKTRATTEELRRTEMTTTKTTYKVSDGYTARKFDDYTEAVKFATDCYKDHMRDGKTREEAAKLVTITTYTTQEETFWDTFGASMFEEEPKVENELTAESGDAEWLDKLLECWSEITTKKFNVETMQYEYKTRWAFMGYCKMPDCEPVKETAKFVYFGEKGERTKYRKPTK